MSTGLPMVTDAGAAAASRDRAVAATEGGRVGMVLNKQTHYGLLGVKPLVDLNLAGDNNLTITSPKYIVRRVFMTDATTSLTTVTVGLFGREGGSVSIICGDQAISELTGPTKWKDLTISAEGLTDIFSANTLVFRVWTPQGAPATATVWVFGESIV